MKDQDVSKMFFNVIPPAMHLVRTYVRRSATPSLTVPQFRVLSNISRGLSHVGEIAELHGISQPGMSKLVSGLVKLGFVARYPFPSDRRVIELKLTKKGQSTFLRMKEEASKSFVSNLELLNKEELAELSHSLACLESFIKKIREQ